VELTVGNPITAAQIILQMIHRLMALVILLAVAAVAAQAWRQLGGRDGLARLATGWLLLIVAQVGLGIATILTNKAADIATLHVMVGALSLVAGALWCVVAFARSAGAAECAPAGSLCAGMNHPLALAGNK
jgi:cytochrome c oxidase assembly protein subunit 15